MIYRIIKINLFTSLGYYLLAAFGIFMAIPPGYASPIWPAAGLALAAVLRFGLVAVPGVFLGSIAINFPNISDVSGINNIEYLIPLLIGVGAALQAYIGSMILGFLGDYKKFYYQTKNVISFLIIGGPFCSLVSSSFAISVLVFFDKIEPSDILLNWFSWWVGDSVGVIIFAPIFLFLLLLKGEKLKHKVFAVIFPLLLFFGFAMGIFYFVSGIEQRNIDRIVNSKLETIGLSITKEMSVYKNVLASLQGFYNGSENVERDEFTRFTEKNLKSLPVLQALEWAPIVKYNEVENFYKLASKDGYPNYVITQKDGRVLQEAAKRDFYFPIYYMEPFVGNEKAFGYDLASTAFRKETIFKSIKYDKQQMSKPVDLVQGGKGVLITMPVWNKDAKEKNIDGVQGVVVAVVKVKEFLKFSSSLSKEENFQLVVFDVTEDSPNFFYSTSPGEVEHYSNKNSKFYKGKYFQTKKMKVFGRTWEVLLVKKSTDLAFGQYWSTWFFHLGNLCFSVLVGILLITLNAFTEKLNIVNLTKRQEILKSNTKRTEFLTNMSHELKTPLNGIMGMVDLLAKTDLPMAAKEKLEIIRQGGNQLLYIINDILDYSTFRAGNIKFEESKFNLLKEIELLIKSMKSSMDDKGNTFSFKHDLRSDVIVEADLIRFKQIVMNFISNANKFTKRGEINLKLHVDSVSDGRLKLSFEVTDTGIGIPAQKQSSLFEPFSQGDSSITRKYRGAGLGLSVSKILIDAFKGDISVESKEGIGSKFSFHIFVKEALKTNEDTDDKGQEETPKVEDNTGFETAQVLLVEDNLVNQQVAQKILQKFDIIPDVASNGLEALAMVRFTKYDIILMDCHMPIMDGFEATTQIREKHNDPKPVIVAISASSMKEDVEKCLAVGMDDFIPKPVRIQDFREIFSKYLERKE